MGWPNSTEWPKVSKPGYYFEGWFPNDEDQEVRGDKVEGTDSVVWEYDHTLYAHWTVNKYRINFNPNGEGATVTPPYKEPYYKEVICGQPYGELASANRPGYTFNGWYTQPSGGTQVTAGKIVTEETINTNDMYGNQLYAHWAANTYAVTFDANGGSVSPSKKSVTYDSVYYTLPTPTREGYKFAGWFISASGGTKVEANTKVTTAENHTLYAQWTPERVVVDFNVLCRKTGENVGGLDGITADFYVGDEGNLTKDDAKDFYRNDDSTESDPGGSVDYGTTITIDDIKVGLKYEYIGIEIYAKDEYDPNPNYQKYADERDKLFFESNKLGRFEFAAKGNIVIWLIVDSYEYYEEFIETDRSYVYSTELADYKVFSKTPNTGGIEANGKTSMVENVTFSFGEYTGNKSQYILGCQDDSGHAMYGILTESEKCIGFGIWNNSAKKYEHLKVDISGLNIKPNDILNATAIYDGTKMELRVRKEGEDSIVLIKEIALELNQSKSVPMILGENPCASTGYEESSNFIPTDSFHKGDASFFTGKIYNARLWYNVTFSDEKINAIYNQGVKEAIDLITYNGHRYYASIIETNSWYDARTRCEEMGGYLATITSDGEQKFVEEITDGSYVDHWLGGTDEGTEGTWRWVTGEEFNYKNWDIWTDGTGMEPNNVNGNEHYLMILQNGKWNDIPWDEEYYYICEWVK